MQKCLIHQIEITEPHGSKRHYNGSDSSYTERSHNKENIENYQFMDELSNKDKEDVKGSE